MIDLEKRIEALEKENAELKQQLEERHKDGDLNKKIEDLAMKYADILQDEMNNPIKNMSEINDCVRILSHFNKMISENKNQNCCHS